MQIIITYTPTSSKAREEFITDITDVVEDYEAEMEIE